MNPTRAESRYARFDDGTAWPLPEAESDDRETVAHAMRYRPDGHMFTMTDRFHVAEVLEAFACLIEMPLTQSRAKLRALKAAMAMRAAKKETTDG